MKHVVNAVVGDNNTFEDSVELEQPQITAKAKRGARIAVNSVVGSDNAFKGKVKLGKATIG
jgi:hypothetical protein